MYKFSLKRIKPIILACGFFCLGMFSSAVLAMDGGENPPQENNERRIELAKVANGCKSLPYLYKQFHSDTAGKDTNFKNLVPDFLKMKNKVTAFHLPEIYLQRINSDMYVILSKIFSLPSCLGRDATSMISTKAKKTGLLLRMNPIYITFNFTPKCGNPCKPPKTIQGCKCSLHKKAGSDRYILNVESAENNNNTKFNLDLLENAYSLEDRNKIESLILNGPKELCGKKFSNELLPNLKEFKSLTLEKISLLGYGSGYITQNAVFTKSNLEKVICPKLESIPFWSFCGCKKLERFEAPSLIYIPYEAFWDCTSLKAISLNVNELGMDSFGYCKSLTELHLPKLRECSTWAFEKCENLKYIRLGCNLKYERLYDNNLDIAKVSKEYPDKMLISLPDNKGTYTIECDLTDEFVKDFNQSFINIFYKVEYYNQNKQHSILEKLEEEGVISNAIKKELARDLSKLVTLKKSRTSVIVDNDYMLKKMTNNTDYFLPDLMSDLYERDYNSLSEDEKKYRDEEKRILSEINKQVFINRRIDRGSLLRNFNKLLNIKIKLAYNYIENKELADVLEKHERQEQLKYKVATALGISALGFFLFFLLLCLIKKR